MSVIQVNEKPPILKAIPLSLQHLFAMFGSTILVPIMFKINPATCLLFNGIGTILYLIICKGKVPAYLGSSFAFFSPVFLVLAQYDYSAALGGFIVSVIGLELMPTAASMAGLTENSADLKNIGIALFTLTVTIFSSIAFKGFLSIIPILIGVVSGYILSAFLGIVDFTAVSEAAFFELPTFYIPTFNLNAALIILPATLVVIVEHTGHLVVTGNIVGSDLTKNPGLDRSLLGNGISTMISGFFGSTPNTTYGENIGVLAITKVFST